MCEQYAPGGQGNQPLLTFPVSANNCRNFLVVKTPIRKEKRERIRTPKESLCGDGAAVFKDAEQQSVKKETVQLWLKRLKDAALDISDMMDDYQDLINMQKQSRVIKLLMHSNS